MYAENILVRMQSNTGWSYDSQILLLCRFVGEEHKAEFKTYLNRLAREEIGPQFNLPSKGSQEAENILHNVAVQAGWSITTKLKVLINFIDILDQETEFERFLDIRACEELGLDPQSKKVYSFPVMLTGVGWSPAEAWKNAVNEFTESPGLAPENYAIVEAL